jgi:dephospho-CoA kinase
MAAAMHNGPTHLVMVGLMGSGKTTVGMALARRLGLPHRDSDVDLLARTGRSARAIAAADGVEALLAVRRGTDARRRAWAVLAFFDGAERAEDAAADRLAAPLRSTRRQNVIAVFGRSDRFGRAPTGAEERRLQFCFDRASA